MRSACLLGLALATAWIGSPNAAVADGCLQKFSCQIYGECRFPCLDEMLGSPPAAPPPAQPTRDAAALDTQPTGPLPKTDAASDTATPTKPAEPKPAKPDPVKPKLARRTPAEGKEDHLRIVAARGIASLAQLAGKPVSFGPSGDRAQAAGRKLFARLGIKVQEMPLDLDNALDGVATGDIAAVLVTRPRDVAKAEVARDAHVLAVPEGVVARGK